MTGRFIVIEGVDGSGKSTQTTRLSVALTMRGYPVFATAEPSGGPVGVLIRERLRGRADMDPSALPYLFAADRADHVARGIGPALARGEVVVCDRYTLSNVVYRAAEVPGPLCNGTAFAPAVLQRARWAQELSATALVPDLTIVLTVSAPVAQERLARRDRKHRELYEHAAMLARCATLYHRADELVGGTGLWILDGEDHPDDVAAAVLDAVSEVLPKMAQPTDEAPAP